MGCPVESRELESLVRERIDRWWGGERPDAAALLEEHPELRHSKSMVLDLAHAEYAIRAAAGESISKSQFCGRFPAYRQSIARLLDVEQYFLDKCPPDDVDDGRVRWPAPGDEFLGFEIVEPLGIGALARVFLARERAVGDRLVVVKISPVVTREAHTLGKLSHPSIVQILHTVRDELDGWTVICMPLAGLATAVDLLDAAFEATARRDGSLVGRVARETLPLTDLPTSIASTERFSWDLTYAEVIARLGLQLAEALEAAHATGIYHRDIKPSNILLAWSGRAMLLDFNLSAEAGADGHYPAGTLAYMAPEVITRLIDEPNVAGGVFDPRGDIYSLGVVLYELFTGHLPFRPQDAESLSLNAYEPWLECKRGMGSDHLARQLSATDSRLAAIVLKCLEYDPAERFESASALAEELRKYLSGGARLGRLVRRRRREVVLVGLGFIAASVGLGSYIVNLPTEFERTYREGLDQFEREEFEGAVASFTKCLELRSGWPHAHFGRAQSLRKLGQWREAKTDFAALRAYDPAWSYALAGFCSMQLNEDRDAAADYLEAYLKGLKNAAFLLNYARVQLRCNWNADAAKLCGEVIEAEPTNVFALRNRAMAMVRMVHSGQKIPHIQAFRDVEEYCRLEPQSMVAPYCAAIVYGEAARKDPQYEEQAARYLTMSIQRGMPWEKVQNYQLQLKRLATLIDADAVMNTQPDLAYRLQLAPMHELPETVDWALFQREFGHTARHVAWTSN